MPGGPTKKIMGLGGLWREVKGLESLGVGIADVLPPASAVSPCVQSLTESAPYD
jgi:hypothetical protein